MVKSKCPLCGKDELINKHGTFYFKGPPNVGHFTIPNSTWEECLSCKERILGDKLDKRLDKALEDRKAFFKKHGIETVHGRRLCIKLVFDDWKKNGKSIYSTQKGVDLSAGDFHSGTTFKGEIHLNPEQEKEFKKALKQGYQPAFWITK